MDESMVSKEYAVEQVRNMAYQFADMYFAFVCELRETFGDEEAKKIACKVLFKRAKERAEEMILRAQEQGLERIPENINAVSGVSYLGWVASLGCDHCPYGTAWKKRIRDNPWFTAYAQMYCDVTDTTIAEVFTGAYSHKLYRNVVLGDQSCERTYFLSDAVKHGERTYEL